MQPSTRKPQEPPGPAARGPGKEAARNVRREIRLLAAQAYEEELGRELTSLREAFAAWERGEITSGGLSDRIHEFHQGPARALWLRYNLRDRRPAAAYAIASGILDPARVSPAVRAELVSLIESFAPEPPPSQG